MENNNLNELVLDKLTKVCICKSINRAAIKKAIASGAKTVIEVKKITGAAMVHAMVVVAHLKYKKF